MNTRLGKALKNFAIWFYQLKIKYKAIRTFLDKIGKIQTPEYW